MSIKRAKDLEILYQLMIRSGSKVRRHAWVINISGDSSERVSGEQVIERRERVREKESEEEKTYRKVGFFF